VRACFVVNPASAACPRDLAERIGRRFPGAPVWETRGAGDGSRLGARAVEEGADLVVACGGDGTVREVATAVGARAILGLVPVGTVNLLARDLGLPRNPEDALAVAASGVAKEVFPGRCLPEGRGEGTLFFLCCSAGPDADAVHAVGLDKRLLGRYAYALRFVLRLLRPIEDDLAWSAGENAGCCAQFLALKLPHYAGRYRVSDACSPFTPGLEVVALAGGRARLLRFFGDALASRVRPRPGVTRFAASDVTLRLPPPGRFQLDGDPFTAPKLRLVAEAVPVRVMVTP
jgi:diacylglycerol kinase family enzyme